MTRQEYNREVSSQATCNWVEVRNQAAIAAMQAYVTRKTMMSMQQVAKCSVEYADALVEELKKGE